MQFVHKLRSGTAARWAVSNRILLEGEPGVEVDTKRFKIGDGISRYDALPYYLSEDAISAFIAEAIANIEIPPIGSEDLNQIKASVLEEIELPDLVLLWENAKA